MKNQKRRKVVFVISSLDLGGAERVMTILANALSELDYEITIISKLKSAVSYPISEEVRLYYPETKVNYRNKLTTFFGRIGQNRDIHRFLLRKKPDVVIPFSTTTNGMIIVMCKILGLPVIASEHMNYKTTSEKFSHRFIRRYIYPHSSFLTVLTKRDKEEYYMRFMKNVVVMPNPLALKPFSNNETASREKCIMAVGDLNRIEHKGFDTLLQIFANIRKEQPDWNLCIAGGGEVKPVEDLIEKFGLVGHVSLLGHIKEVQKYLQSCSIFALSSRWEGLPLVLVEAMSQGIACIAFDCFTGPAEMITNGFDGILVEDQNRDSFEKELSKLITDEGLRKELGRHAIDSSRRFIPEEIVPLWQELIEKACSN